MAEHAVKRPSPASTPCTARRRFSEPDSSRATRHGIEERIHPEVASLRPLREPLFAQLEGQTIAVTSTGRSLGVVTSGSTTLDGAEVAEGVPVPFFGQREIYNIAEDRAATPALVDDLHRDELTDPLGKLSRYGRGV